MGQMSVQRLRELAEKDCHGGMECYQGSCNVYDEESGDEVGYKWDENGRAVTELESGDRDIRVELRIRVEVVDVRVVDPNQPQSLLR